MTVTGFSSGFHSDSDSGSDSDSDSDSDYDCDCDYDYDGGVTSEQILESQARHCPASTKSEISRIMYGKLLKHPTMLGTRASTGPGTFEAGLSLISQHKKRVEMVKIRPTAREIMR